MRKGTFPISYTCKNLTTALIIIPKASILVIEGDYIMFASPIVQDRALAHCFSEGQADPVDLDTFIVSVVIYEIRGLICVY